MPALFLHVMIGSPGFSRKAALYRTNFIRLIDKALYEYQEARFNIIAQIEEARHPAKKMEREGRKIYVFNFVNHLETCINAIARLYKLLDRIKAEHESPSVPKIPRKLLETHINIFTDVRDTIEHIDEKIQKDEIKEGQPIMLAIPKEGEDKAIIGSYSMSFNDVAIVLGKFHEIGSFLLQPKTE